MNDNPLLGIHNANFTVSLYLDSLPRSSRIHFSFFHGFTMQNSQSTYIISDNGLLFPKGVISTPSLLLQLPHFRFLQFVTVKLFPFFRFSKGRNLTLKGHKRLSQMRRNGEDMLDREKELKMDPQKRWSLKANLSTQKTISRFLLT